MAPSIFRSGIQGARGQQKRAFTQFLWTFHRFPVHTTHQCPPALSLSLSLSFQTLFGFPAAAAVKDVIAYIRPVACLAALF